MNHVLQAWWVLVADEVHNHSSVCRTESDTWTTSRSPCLLLLPGEQLLDSREPLDTHTHSWSSYFLFSHTLLPLPEEWVKENALYVCLTAERSIIYMDGDGQGGVFSLVLSSTVWTFPFCYCTSVCPRRHPLWSVLHFAFFHRKPWRVQRSMNFLFSLLSLVVSPSVTFLFLAVFTQVLLFLSPASFLLLFTFFFCIYLFLPLSPIFTSIYLSQFCLKEEVSHFFPHF